MHRALVGTLATGLALSSSALANTVTEVGFPNFTLNGSTPVDFTETLSPGGETYGLRLQAEWSNVASAWSSEFQATVTAPNGDTFDWRPAGGVNNNDPFSFDLTRYLAFPFGTPADGDWTFTFDSSYPSGVADLESVQIDLIELETYEYESETLHGGDTWFRPEGMGPDLSPFGPVNYHVQEFSVLEDGIFDIYSEHEGFDGVLYLYEDSFDPEDQLTNLIAVNDDGRTPLTTSELLGLELDADRDYFLVTSAWEACDVGHLRNVIGGTSGVVPEPTTLMLLAIPAMMFRRRN